ncbi:MAG: hypothetical protein PHH28_04770 [Desulfuromonadaceae bacterium]|nr:hypothetical protein [Desulfuromonadaceae bacterium]
MCAWVSIGKDVILSISAIVSVSLAIYGLKSWQRELAGKTRFEAARRLLLAVYKIREEFWTARNPFIPAAEFPSGWTGSYNRSTEEEFQANLHVYKHRWEQLMATIQDLEASSLEAEVLWGQHIKVKTDEILECLSTYRTSIDSKLDSIRSGSGGSDHEFTKSVQQNLHATRKGTDQLSKKMKDAITSVEEVVKPFLKHDS